jgi:DNA repair exonuclease SbcCD ATPase subunit
MKKTAIILTIAILAGTMTIHAQPGKRKEQIRAYKIAFITERLQLTPDEAEKFWPLYNEFEAAQQEVREEMESRFGGPPPRVENMSDEELDEMIRQHIGNEKRMADLKMEYYDKFREVISVRKVFQLYQSEGEFRRKLLERLKHEGGPGKRGF